MPSNVTKIFRLGHLQTDSSSSSNSEAEEEPEPVQENSRHFNAIDMVKAVDMNTWPSSEDEEVPPRKPVVSARKKFHEVKIIEEISTEETSVQGSKLETLKPNPIQHVDNVSTLVNSQNQRKQSTGAAAKEPAQVLTVSETTENEPKEYPKCRRRSSVFGLLQFSMGKKEPKAKSLTLDEHISELEKKIAKKMKKLDELQLQLQELKNRNTH